MKTHSPENERIKRQYFTYLKEAKRYSESSLDGVASALHGFEAYTKYRDFRDFHIGQAVGFKRHLAEQVSCRTKERLSKATLYSTLMALRNFFHWLAGRSGYRSRLSYSDADYFNLSEKETRIAKAHRDQLVPTIGQIEHVIQMMPAKSDIERRNRALIAFALVTGARDSAVASLKLKHIDVAAAKVIQDAREVRTKFSKSFTTVFFPVGDHVQQIVVDWVGHLMKDKLWGPDDPVFPATRVVVGVSRKFEASGLDRKHWSNAAPIRAIFRDAFTRAGLPYFNPHSFRKTLVQLGEKLCQTPEEFKAWSQNLGHEKVLTTFSSYGEVAAERQTEIIRQLAQPIDLDPQFDEILKQLIRATRRRAAG
jgi:integrase/recombinase XerD